MILLFSVLGVSITHAQSITKNNPPLSSQQLNFGKGLNSRVSAIAYFKNNWYAGGEFTNANGVSVGYIARWDQNKWKPLLSGLNGPVLAMYSHSGKLFVGGSFTTAGGITVNNIAAWDGFKWESMDLGLNSTVRAITVHNNVIHIGGDFTFSGTSSTPRLAFWDETIKKWISYANSPNARVNTLLSVNSGLLVGGEFTQIGTLTHSRIALWDGSSWQNLGAGLDKTVHSLALYKERIIAGGAFTKSGSQQVSSLAEWTGVEWKDLGGTLKGTVKALIQNKNQLIVAGLFKVNENSNNAAVLNDQGWFSLGNPDSTVHTLSIQDDVVYFGGDFKTTNTSSTPFVSRIALTLPEIPIVIEPRNKDLNLTTRPTIKWDSKTAFQTQIQISIDQGYADVELDTTVEDVKQLNIVLKRGLNPYYLRLRTINNLGFSEWSKTQEFKTILYYPKAIQPIPGSKGLNKRVLLKWEELNSAQSYHLQVSETNHFDGNLIVNRPGIPGDVSEFELQDLLDDATYYWRIRAEYSDNGFFQSTDWSDVSAFTVNLTPATPVPQSPLSNTISDSSSTVFRWGRVATADLYRVQISTDISFASPIFDDNVSADSLVGVRLNAMKSYYWRVRAINPGGSSPWSNPVLFSTQIPSPSKPIPSSPSNNLTGVSLTPKITWLKARAAEQYTLQVSSTSTFSTDVLNFNVDKDTTYQVRTLQPSLIYYWRVKALNSIGESDWSSTLSFRTTSGQVPQAAPVLVSPVNNATNLSENVQFNWQLVNGSTAYRFQLATDPEFKVIHSDKTLNNTNEVNIDNVVLSQTYFWRVSAINSSGEGSWSAPFRFSTTTVSPLTPQLLSPQDSSMVSLPLTLQWQKVVGAEDYVVQYSTIATFQSAETSTITAQNSLMVSNLQASQRYFWRVRARNLIGISDWSSIKTFITAPAAPEQVVLATPQTGLLNVPLTTTIRWMTTAGANKYRLQLSQNADFRESLFTDILVDTTFQTISRLNGGERYYWRVSAINNGGQGIWSEVRSFVTVPPIPLTPTLLFPASTLNFIKKPDRLSWTNTGLVDTYDLQLSKNQEMDSALAEFIINGSTSIPSFDLTILQELESNMIYYWRVRSKNSTGISSWSDIFVFKTNPNRPSKVDLLNPPENSLIDNINNVVFEWAPAQNAVFYQFELSESPDFKSNFTPTITVDATRYSLVDISPLSANKLFYWRVQAGNTIDSGNQYGDWSQVRSFRTKPNPPDTVQIISPTKGIIGASRNQIFRWKKQTNVSSYVIQVSTTSEFTTLIQLRKLSSEKDTAHVFLPDFGKQYFWRLRAENEGGLGPWSVSQDLTTFTYSDQLNTNFTVSFSNTNQSSYRLVSIPGDINVPLHNTLSNLGSQGTDWNAFTFENGTLVEAKSGDPRFNFKPGKAFWLLSKKPWVLNRTSDKTVPLNNNDAFIITDLKPGWNLISNPFNIPVTWRSVLDANELSDRAIHFFTNAGWSQPNTLEPNQGYYYDNREGITQLIIPYPVSTRTLMGSESPTLASKIQEVQLVLTRNTEQLGSSKLILLDKLDGSDTETSQGAPPQHFESNRMYWLNEKKPGEQTYWYSYVQRWTGTPVIQSLKLYLMESGTYQISINTLVESEIQVRLFDKKNHRWLVSQNGYIDVYLAKGDHEFDVVLAYPSDISNIELEFLPKEFMLFDNYPNPFNPTTTLRFALPEPNQVQLAIYDITGRKVSTLIGRRMEAGYHNIDWSASHLASGVYIVELIAGQQRRIQKITLVK